MNLSNLKVSTETLLGIVKENKEKHDQIYEAAEKGYWLEAENYLKEYQKEMLNTYKKQYLKDVKELKKQVTKELKAVEEKKRTGYLYLRKPFPENHSDDYECVIKKLEMATEPRIELYPNEFDSYVRNKWDWRKSFLATNTSYAISSTFSSGSSSCLSYNNIACTGSLSSVIARF